MSIRIHTDPCDLTIWMSLVNHLIRSVDMGVQPPQFDTTILTPTQDRLTIWRVDCTGYLGGLVGLAVLCFDHHLVCKLLVYTCQFRIHIPDTDCGVN